METPPRIRRPDKMRVVDRVSRSLEDAILTGEIPPGHRLVEQTLAEQLSVSRTTVREALLMLQQAGLVEREPRGATIVTRLSPSAAWDVSKMRALLEGYAVRAGFPMYDDRFFSDLRRIAEEMRTCQIPGEIPRLVALDMEFHEAIVVQARSTYLFSLWETLNSRVRALYLVTMESLRIEPARVAAFHDQLIDHLASGDVDRAQGGMLHHYIDGWPKNPEESAEFRRILGLLTVEWDWQSRIDRNGKLSSCSG